MSNISANSNYYYVYMKIQLCFIENQFYGKNGKEKIKDIVKATEFWGQQVYSYSRL